MQVELEDLVLRVCPITGMLYLGVEGQGNAMFEGDKYREFGKEFKRVADQIGFKHVPTPEQIKFAEAWRERMGRAREEIDDYATRLKTDAEAKIEAAEHRMRMERAILTVDGKPVTTGDRYVEKIESQKNGIYKVTQTGDGGVIYDRQDDNSAGGLEGD